MIPIGCQTYTWEMLGQKWKGKVDDILKTVSEAGYSGIEITNTMIGKYYENPENFARSLEHYELKFPAFGFVPLHGFTSANHVEEEIAAAQRGINFVSNFPKCRLVLAGGSTNAPEGLQEKFKTMCTIYNRVAELAEKQKVAVDVHAHSHAGSIIESEEEYDKLMDMTNKNLVGWNPDTGHIVRGGVDLLRLLTKHQTRIRHLHFKDVGEDGKWRMLGRGICDFKGIMKLLEEISYSGWVICEEESDEAWDDQRSTIQNNRNYLKNIGY